VVLRVRPITNDEGNKLRRIVRHGHDRIEAKRAQVILASAQGFTAPVISQIAIMDEDYVRDLIKAFNLHGFAMLKPKWGPGGPRKFTDEQRNKLVQLATSRPKDLGLPFQQWSLSRLRKAAMDRGIVESISEEWLRVILHEADISHQSIRTWKESSDPEFEKKKQRVDRLTRKRHNPPVVISADEIGPIQLIPHGGKGWFGLGRPGRIPADYNRKFGTVYYMLSLNVHRQKLSGDVYLTKHAVKWLEFMRRERAKYPRDHVVYWIQDNSSNHWTPEIRGWARKNRMRLVATATRASWMNPVESHAGDLQNLALAGTEFTKPEEVKAAMDGAVTYRNEERKDRGKTYGDTRRDRRRRAKKPIWRRPT
jgi:transposase